MYFIKNAQMKLSRQESIKRFLRSLTDSSSTGLFKLVLFGRLCSPIIREISIGNSKIFQETGMLGLLRSLRLSNSVKCSSFESPKKRLPHLLI